MTDIIDELTWRGLIALTTDPDELRKSLTAGEGPVTFYGGFDPTAPGLHIGNLVLLLTMRRLQLAGHRPIGLVGGATGLIGDPSGKVSERMLNPRELVAQWVERIRDEVGRFLDFDAGPTGALLVSNLDWTEHLPALEFLRDIGKHVPVNQMLSRESVKTRLEAGGISYTEFSYQVLQAYDFLELYRRHECTLQLGGSDQWGNLVAGVDLIRRVTGASVHALATPLITKPDGTKYGKTEGGAVWISPDLMSPYAFYQFWINRADDEVPGLLRVFTFRSREEIEALEREITEKPAARAAQRVLAEDVTTLVHGTRECQQAIAASRALFGQGDLAELDERTLASALAEVPTVRVWLSGSGYAITPALPSPSATTPGSTAAAAPPASAGAADGTPHVPIPPPHAPSAAPASPVIAVPPDSPSGGGEPAGELARGPGLPPIVDLMAATGIVPSKSAARRAVAEGGAYVNNHKLMAEDARLDPADLLHGRFLVLRRGKRVIGGVEVLRA